MTANARRPRPTLAIATVMLLACCLAVAAPTAPPSAPATTTPKTIVLDGPALVKIRSELGAPTKPQRLSLKELLKRADADIAFWPAPVGTGPAGANEYYSQAPYWWECDKPPVGKQPTKCKQVPKSKTCPNGLSYVQYDGETNHLEIDKYHDHANLTATWHAIYVLSLAWFYTGKQSYANAAETDVRAFFLDSHTGMKPNFKFAQIIPCSDALRGDGIIESSERITQVIDALALLDSGAPNWTPADHQAMQSWLTAFSQWMETSPQGVKESGAANNHGSWKDLQDAVLEFYVGNTSKAHDLVSQAKKSPINLQIVTDGHQPLETKRSRSWHYSNFNATALCRLAEVGRHVNVPLWTYVGPGGGSLQGAVDFLIPAFEHNSGGSGNVKWWPFPNIRDTDAWPIAVYLLHAADEEAGDTQAHTALMGYTMPTPKTHGVDMWPLVPACSPVDGKNVDEI